MKKIKIVWMDKEGKNNVVYGDIPQGVIPDRIILMSIHDVEEKAVCECIFPDAHSEHCPMSAK